MSDITYIGQQMRSFTSAPQFDGYSKVVITVSDEQEYSAGTDTGRTLSLTCPWGTQAMADNILKKIQGFQYQPYTATDTKLDPAAELGDGVTANNVYSGIYTKNIKFGPYYTATISAPEDEEINHEYEYVPKQERTVKRSLRTLTAELKVQAGLISAEVEERKSDMERLTSQLQVQAGAIEAKVSKTGGSSASFGWILDDSSWTIKANGKDVLKATKDGLEISGKIIAEDGEIGGFTITSDSLSYNKHKWGGTNETGIYIGKSGIQLGKNFKITNKGELTAKSGTFSGTVKAEKIAYGTDSDGNYNGYFPGGGISTGSVSGNRMEANTITTAYTSSGINNALSRAEASYDALFNNARANAVACDQVSADQILLEGRNLGRSTISYVGADGSNHSINVVTWSNK